MLSFIEARGGGTSLLSSTLMTPVGILFKHYRREWLSKNYNYAAEQDKPDG